MYQVIVKGRNLEELRKAISDINDELTVGHAVVKGVQKDLALACIDSEVTDSTVQLELPLEEDVRDVPNTVVELPAGFEVSPPAIQQAGGVQRDELDSRGIPWDERVHSKSKAKVADGSWRARRGIDKDLLKQVESELTLSIPVVEVILPTCGNIPVVAIPPVTPVVETVVAQPETKTLPLITTPAVTAPPVTPVVTAPVLPPPVAPAPITGHSVETFKQNYAMIIADLVTKGKINQDYVNQLKLHFDVPEIWELDDEQKEQLFTNFVSFGFIQGT